MIEAIVQTVSKVADIGDKLAGMAEKEQLMSAGEARQTAETLKGLVNELNEHRQRLARFDADPDFQRIVQQYFRDPDEG